MRDMPTITAQTTDVGSGKDIGVLLGDKRGVDEAVKVNRPDLGILAEFVGDDDLGERFSLVDQVVNQGDKGSGDEASVDISELDLGVWMARDPLGVLGDWF